MCAATTSALRHPEILLHHGASPCRVDLNTMIETVCLCPDLSQPTHQSVEHHLAAWAAAKI